MQSACRFAIFIALTTVLPAMCATAPPVVLEAIPSPVMGLSPPNTGSLAVHFQDPNGLSDLQVVYVNIGPPGGGGAPNSCGVGYVLYTREFFLFNDAGTGLVGTLDQGAGGSLSNSTCTLTGSGSGGSFQFPNDFYFVLNLTMAPFSGSRNIYGYAQSYTGANSGWQIAGSWVPAQTLGVASLTPRVGSGSPQTFSTVFTDPNGVADLQVAYLDFGNAANAENSCIVAYVPFNNTLYLLSDDNSGASGPIMAGGTDPPLSNSQCTLSPSGGSGVISLNTVNVAFAITFAPTFNGPKGIFGLAQSNSLPGNGYQGLGTWTPFPAQPLGAVSLDPDSGAGPMQTFTATYTDPKGVPDLQVVYFLMNPVANANNGCAIAYAPAANAIYLMDDDPSTAVAGSLTPGGSGSLSNSQCTVSSGGPVSIAGNNVTIPFSVMFKGSFTGSKNLYGLAQTLSGARSGWLQFGSWTP